MSKIRVHELAKELNKSSKDVIYALKGHGVLVESHMSTIPDESAEKIRKFFTAPPVKKQEAPKAPVQDKAPVEAKPAYNNGDRQQRPNNGERRPFNGDRQQRPNNGERRPFNGDRQQRPNNGERRPFNGDRNNGERPQRPNNGERRPFNGDRNNGDRPQRPNNGERRPFNGDRQQRPNNGERRPFNGDRNNGERPQRPNNGERRPFNGDRNNGERPNRQGGFNNRDNRDNRDNNRDNRGGNRGNFNNNRGEGKFNLDNAISKEVVVTKDTSRENRRNFKDKEKPVKSVTDGRSNGKKGMGGKPLTKKTDLQKPTQKPKPVVEKVTNIVLPEVITIKDLGDKMKISAAEIVKKLFFSGKMVTLNTEITYDEAEEIALEYEILCEHEVVVDPIEEILREEEENEDDLQPRHSILQVSSLPSM